MATANGAQDAVVNANATAAGGNNSNANANDGNRADTSRVADANGGGTNAGPKKYEYTEDRSDWVPRHRLGEESGKRTEAEKERDRLKADLEAATKRVQALAGVNPQDPKAQEAAEVKAALQNILSELGLDLDALKGLTKQEIAELREQAGAGRAAHDAQYDRQRDETFGRLYDETARVINVEKLDDDQQEQVRSAFAAKFRREYTVESQAQADGRATDPNSFVQRYLRNDPGLVKEFVQSYLKAWFEPARRTVTQNTIRRQTRPVPSGGRGEPVITKLPEADLSTDDGFKKAMIAARSANQG